MSHVIVIAGYAMIPDRDGTAHLWLLIADPSPGGGKTKDLGLSTPAAKQRSPNKREDLEFLGDLKDGEDHFIGLYKGKWEMGRASMYLMRASLFFQRSTNPYSIRRGSLQLFMDHMMKGEKTHIAGGFMQYSVIPTPQVDNITFSSGQSSSSLVFPFETRRTSQPYAVQQYFLSENSGTGLYPLGVNRCLHGGVHLFPARSADQLDHPVRCLAPGYIVAARLAKPLPAATTGKHQPTETQHRKSQAEIDFLNAHRGFVLVRHELFEPPANPNDTPGPGRPFYSLYMHMPPTKWPDDANDRFGNVTWLRRFHFGRAGAAVNLDPQSSEFGTVKWVAANNPVSEKAKECEVWQGQPVHQPGKPTSHKMALELTVVLVPKQASAEDEYRQHGRLPEITIQLEVRKILHIATTCRGLRPAFAHR
jgi:hypothetical protein